MQQLRAAGDPPRAAVQLLLRLLADGVVPRVRRPGRPLLQEHQRLPQGAGGRAGIKTSMERSLVLSIEVVLSEKASRFYSATDLDSRP